MSTFRPGKFKITDSAMDIWKLPKKSKVLEIGCAEGDCTAYMTEKYGFEMTGIDISLDMVSKAKKKHPDLNIKYGDGEILSDFMSFSFDGVMMECVLSLINLSDEALHEAYCVLKKGGKLFISDLYMRNPNPAKVKAIAIEAKRIASLPRKEGDCESDDKQAENKILNFRYQGRFIENPLIDQLKEIGFTNIKFEDRTPDLQEYVAQKIFDDGNLDDCMTCAKKDKDTGYFMLTAEKPL